MCVGKLPAAACSVPDSDVYKVVLRPQLSAVQAPPGSSPPGANLTACVFCCCLQTARKISVAKFRAGKVRRSGSL
jgi:hypothetical protein